jgi:hypothetical protein
MIIMQIDKPRKKIQREPRRQANKQAAWITLDDGLTTCECLVLDVAPGGAKIITEAAIDIGDKFGLALVPAHPKRQPCEVVWRRGNMHGIKFLP